MSNEIDEKFQKRHLLNKPVVFIIGIRLARVIPRFLTYRIAEAVAYISYRLCSKARASVNRNLKRVFPDASTRHLHSLTRRTFFNYSRYLVDYSAFSNIDRDRIMKEITHVEGTDRLYEALSRGKGVILMTAHLGNWELGGLFFGSRDDIKINVITTSDGIPRIDAIKEQYRKLFNVNTIVLEDGPFAAIEILNALGRNEIVAMLVDRGGEGGVSVPFFGQYTNFPSGPLLLAAHSGAPIMAGFVVKEKGGYLAKVEESIYVQKRTAEEMENAARKTMEIFESYIRRYPDQWYNFVPV